MSRYLRKVAGMIVAGLRCFGRQELITLGIGDWRPAPPIRAFPVPADACATATVSVPEPPGLTRLYEILREF